MSSSSPFDRNRTNGNFIFVSNGIRSSGELWNQFHFVGARATPNISVYVALTCTNNKTYWKPNNDRKHPNDGIIIFFTVLFFLFSFLYVQHENCFWNDPFLSTRSIATAKHCKSCSSYSLLSLITFSIFSFRVWPLRSPFLSLAGGFGVCACRCRSFSFYTIHPYLWLFRLLSRFFMWADSFRCCWFD